MIQEKQRFTIYLPLRTVERLKKLCNKHKENRSRMIASIIEDEYRSVKGIKNEK